MRTLCVGVDVGSSICELVAVDKESGAVLAKHRVGTWEKALAEALLVLGRKGTLEVHLEASSMAAWVRGIAKPLAKRVVVSHPQTNAWIAKDALKDDRLDAWKLADLLRMGKYREVYYSDDPGRQEFKRLVQNFAHASWVAAEMKVKIKDSLRGQGVIAKSASAFTKKGRVEALAAVQSSTMREMIGGLYGTLDALVKAKVEAAKLMTRHGERYPEVERFQRVPGIGKVLACVFSAYIQMPERFKTKRKLWRYCRLGIARRRSNDQPIAREALDRNGCPALKQLSRTAFVAVMKTRDDNAFKRAYLATLARTQDKVHARLTVQRKILATLWAMWRKNTEYDDKQAG